MGSRRNSPRQQPGPSFLGRIGVNRFNITIAVSISWLIWKTHSTNNRSIEEASELTRIRLEMIQQEQRTMAVLLEDIATALKDHSKQIDSINRKRQEQRLVKKSLPPIQEIKGNTCFGCSTVVDNTNYFSGGDTLSGR